MEDLKMETGTVPESDLMKIIKKFGGHVPEEIELPYSSKLTDKHTLVIERRSTQRVTEKGLVPLINYRVHENMVNRVGRE
jgi:hypothetical protein